MKQEMFYPEKIKKSKEQIISITDTHNAGEIIDENLKYHNVINEMKNWKEYLENVTVVHMGDLINKDEINHQVVKKVKHLQETAPESCSFEYILGNHEMEHIKKYINNLKNKNYRPDNELFDFLKLASQSSVLMIKGPILYLHGYPTLELVNALDRIKREGKDFEIVNESFRKKFKKSLTVKDIKPLSAFLYEKDANNKAYFKDIRGKDLINYYKKNGKKIAKLLKKIGIEIVVHGHAARKSQTHADYEFKKELQGIRMINSDVTLAKTQNKMSLGSTKIELTKNKKRPTIKFINKGSF